MVPGSQNQNLQIFLVLQYSKFNFYGFWTVGPHSNDRNVILDLIGGCYLNSWNYHLLCLYILLATLATLHYACIVIYCINISHLLLTAVLYSCLTSWVFCFDLHEESEWSLCSSQQHLKAKRQPDTASSRLMDYWMMGDVAGDGTEYDETEKRKKQR